MSSYFAVFLLYLSISLSRGNVRRYILIPFYSVSFNVSWTMIIDLRVLGVLLSAGYLL